MPEAGSATDIDAEFHNVGVKLYFQNPSSDASGKIFSETYLLIGVLHPTPLPAVLGAVKFERETGNRDIACGSDKTKVEVHSKSVQHPMIDPDATHALIYFVQTDEFHGIAVLGQFTTKYGLDGNWIGGNNKGL